jgi:hypothetical protein
VRDALEAAQHGEASMLAGNARMPVEDALRYARELQRADAKLGQVRVQKVGPWLWIEPGAANRP